MCKIHFLPLSQCFNLNFSTLSSQNKGVVVMGAHSKCSQKISDICYSFTNSNE